MLQLEIEPVKQGKAGDKFKRAFFEGVATIRHGKYGIKPKYKVRPWSTKRRPAPAAPAVVSLAAQA